MEATDADACDEDTALFADCADDATRVVSADAAGAEAADTARDSAAAGRLVLCPPNRLALTLTVREDLEATLAILAALGACISPCFVVFCRAAGAG